MTSAWLEPRYRKGTEGYAIKRTYAPATGRAEQLARYLTLARRENVATYVRWLITIFYAP
jgi:hypothetical protein